MYPSTLSGRKQLADELTAAGYQPTQTKPNFDRAKIDQMVADMTSGRFDWRRSALRPVVLGPRREILGGHHRIIAAHLAGVDLNSIPGQIARLTVAYRPTYDWIDVLPDVR